MKKIQILKGVKPTNVASISLDNIQIICVGGNREKIE